MKRTKAVVEGNRAGSAQLSDILAEMNRKGGFSIAVITDQNGFPVASSAAPGEDPDMQSAVVALVQKTAVQAHNQLGMAQADEISLFDEAGQRLVCRPFSVNDHNMILAVRIPDKRQTYRRLTNQAIRDIKKLWRL